MLNYGYLNHVNQRDQHPIRHRATTQVAHQDCAPAHPLRRANVFETWALPGNRHVPWRCLKHQPWPRAIITEKAVLRPGAVQLEQVMV